jgi:hypothetical protein
MANGSPSPDEQVWEMFVALAAANPDAQPDLLARRAYQFTDAFNIACSEEEAALKAPSTNLKGPPAF